MCYPKGMGRRFQQIRVEAGIFFSYFIVSLIVLFPLLPHLFSRLPFASNGDIRLSLAVLFSNLSKVAHGDLASVFQLPILFPLSHTMTAGINLFGQTLLVFPLFLIQVRNVYFFYNLLTFLAYCAAGYCAYRFMREWITERWIAWLIGALYILLPFRVHNIPHLNLMFSFPIPLTLLFFSRFVKNGKTRDLAFFFLSLISQFLFDLSLGLFLAIALAIFFLVRQVLFGLLPRRSWILLLAASILLVLSMALVFLPYLNKNISFSITGEVGSIPSFAFHSPLSFYNNWSYLLLSFKRIVWHQAPYSPGITVFFFFMLAFVPYLSNRIHKALTWLSLSFLIIPAFSVPFIFKSIQFDQLEMLCGWALMLFLLSLALLLFLLRKKIPAELLWLTVTWMLLQFFSSQISLPFFNLFQGLARLFPFLLRTRYIRSEYILLLLFFAVSAFGISYFFRRFREKKLALTLVLLLVFAERMRWPVNPEKLKDDRPAVREIYQCIAPYPEHFGVLELPFEPLEPNHFALFTIYHNKHTYHGNVNYLKDHYQLERNPQLSLKNEFSGLSDPQFIQMLKEKGIRLIILFKNKENSEHQKTWYAIQNQIRLGAAKGLYAKIEKTAAGTLLVLDEREKGPLIRYFLPHYCLRNKKHLACTIAANNETEADILFNGLLLERHKLETGRLNKIVIDLKQKPLALQSNYLEIRSGRSLELVKVRIK